MRSASSFDIAPCQGHVKAEGNQCGQQVTPQRRLRDFTEDEYSCRTGEQKQLCVVRLFALPAPLLAPVPAAKKEEKAPGEKSSKVYRNIVKDSLRAVQVRAGGVAQQAFFPEGILRESRVAKRNLNEPG